MSEILYKHAFLAVPLPNYLEEQFFEIQEKFNRVRTYIKPVDRKIPHCTILYFNNQKETEFKQISEKLLDIFDHKPELKNTIIQFDGFGKFENEKIHYFIKIATTPSLITLHNQLEQDLSVFSIRKMHENFYPHITIGKTNRTDFDTDSINLSEIESLINKPTVSFTVYELGLYGKDITQRNPHQELLKIIPVK